MWLQVPSSFFFLFFFNIQLYSHKILYIQVFQCKETTGTQGTVGFVQHRVIFGLGTVFHGTGTVWENPTHGLPMLNPKHRLCCIVSIIDNWWILAMATKICVWKKRCGASGENKKTEKFDVCQWPDRRRLLKHEVINIIRVHLWRFDCRILYGGLED